MMDTIQSIKPILAVVISFAAVPFLAACRKPDFRESLTFAAALTKFLIVASMLPPILDGKMLQWSLFHVFPNVTLSFRVDPLGLLFALVASFLWIVTSGYSIGYMRGLKEHSQTRYFCYFALALSATMGVAFSANLFTLYLFYEMLSFATYPLVTHHQDGAARRSGRKYLAYIVGGSIGLVLPAMLLVYLRTGTLDFSPQGIVATSISKPLATVVLLMFVFGFAKAALMPLHAWLPAAMVAPTPVSALLHAVAVVKVGVFSLVRVLTGIFGNDVLSGFHLDTLLCLVASITILAGSLIALTQDELKRRLAFSTISQLSYIVLGASLLSPAGMIGGITHIAMHAFGKITLFFCAGAIYVSTGKRYVSEMVGIGKRMPITMGAFFIGSLSVIGIPPTGGFFSKWYLALGTIEAGRHLMLVVLLVSSLLNAAYFLPIVYRAFFFTEAESPFGDKMMEAPPWCVAPLVITAATTIGLFFYPDLFLGLAKRAIGR